MSKPLLQIVPDAQNTRNYQFIRDTIGRLDSRFQQEVFWFAERRSLGGLYRSFLSFHRLLKQKSFALVHCQYGGVNLLLGLYAKFFFKTILVVTFRGSDINNAKTLSSRISALTSRAFASLCDHVICVSRGLSEKLFFVKAEKLSIIPTGVDTKAFFPIDQAQSREQLGLQLNKLYWLFNEGGRPELKGRTLVNQVAVLVSQELPNSDLIILDGKCTREKVPLYMAASDCLVLASYAEGSPNIVKESLCCSLPVVSLKVGDVEELLDGVTPSYISSSNPREFADKVISVLRTKKRCNSDKKIEQLSKEREIESLTKIYRSLLIEGKQ